MIKTNYANAYKEVLVILDRLIKEDYNKIPKEYIEFLTANCNNDYEFYYDTSKTIEQQELLDDTKYILFGLFEKFGATDLQKEKIKAFRNKYYNQLEKEKSEKYNTYNIFNKKNNENEEVSNNLIIEVKKENLYQKIVNFIKRILNI